MRSTCSHAVAAATAASSRLQRRLCSSAPASAYSLEHEAHDLRRRLPVRLHHGRRIDPHKDQSLSGEDFIAAAMRWAREEQEHARRAAAGSSSDGAEAVQNYELLRRVVDSGRVREVVVEQDVSGDAGAEMLLGLSRLAAVGVRCVARGVPPQLWPQLVEAVLFRHAEFCDEAEEALEGFVLVRLATACGLLLEARTLGRIFLDGASSTDGGITRDEYVTGMRAALARVLRALEVSVAISNEEQRRRNQAHAVVSPILSTADWAVLVEGCGRGRVASTALFQEASYVLKATLRRQRSDPSFHAVKRGYEEQVFTPKQLADIMWGFGVASFREGELGSLGKGRLLGSVDADLALLDEEKLEEEEEELKLVQGVVAVHDEREGDVLAADVYQTIGNYLTEVRMEESKWGSYHKNAKNAASKEWDRRDLTYHHVSYRSNLAVLPVSDINKVLWGFAAVSYKHNLLVKGVTQETISAIAAFTPADYVSSAWAFSSIGAFSPEYLHIHASEAKKRVAARVVPFFAPLEDGVEAAAASDAARPFFSKRDLLHLCDAYSQLYKSHGGRTSHVFNPKTFLRAAAASLSARHSALLPSERMMLSAAFERVGLGVRYLDEGAGSDGAPTAIEGASSSPPPAAGSGGHLVVVEASQAVAAAEAAGGVAAPPSTEALSKTQLKKLKKERTRVLKRASKIVQDASTQPETQEKLRVNAATGDIDVIIDDDGSRLAHTEEEVSSSLTPVVYTEDYVTATALPWGQTEKDRSPRRAVVSKWRTLEGLFPRGEPVPLKHLGGARITLPPGGFRYGTVELLR